MYCTYVLYVKLMDLHHSIIPVSFPIDRALDDWLAARDRKSIHAQLTDMEVAYDIVVMLLATSKEVQG